MTDVEAHYERLLFRSRAEKAKLQARLEACESLVRSLADGSLPWTSADHAAQALVAEMDKDASGEGPAPRDNPVPCAKPDIDWECGGCGLFLGSRPSPDFGDYPCVCGRRNRPRPVHPNSHNALLRRKK